MTSSRPSLSQLRADYRAARDEAEIMRLLDSLADDPRVGAREIRERGLRRIESDRAERLRIANLLALRDELDASGVRGIAGIDEVGVGPLAGPVVAAAVILPEHIEMRGLDDSKRVRKPLRESLAREIHEVAVGVGIAEVSVDEIDQIGIYQAALEAMRRSVASLERCAEVGHLLVDAREVPGVALPQTSIIKGDSKDASIAAASIVAKVHRDAIMERLALRYPGYGFERHRGYGTEVHLAALDARGPCPAHRHSFAPVADAARKHATDRARSTRS